MINILTHNVKAELLKDGRSIKLLASYYFTDAKGVTWVAPKDAIVDGASIPRPLWSISGPPLTGKYRDASIVHDVYCVSREAPYEDTHYMFWELMIASGVAKWKAHKMWFAVSIGGPRWDANGVDLDKTPEALAFENDTEEW